MSRIAMLLLVVVGNSYAANTSFDETLRGDFVAFEAGCFQMGEAVSNGYTAKGYPIPPRADELPRHEVCVDAFEIGRTEVTEAMWGRLMGGPAKTGEGLSDSRKPVASVSWDEAQDFIARLNGRSGGYRYRLPTEAEWEYACRPGEPSEPLGDQYGPRMQQLIRVAWYAHPIRSDKTSRDVAEMEPSPVGLHDMLGNVWEWVADAYLPDAYRQHARQNPVVEGPVGRRVLRGGSYLSSMDQARCGARAWGLQDGPLPTVGFRVVRQPK